MKRAKRVFLSVGSNLGDREQNLRLALSRLEENGISVAACSSVYETEPQDVLSQPWFLNMVARCSSDRFPLSLLAAVQKVERELGRIRDEKSIRRGPRLIDIDILLFEDIVMNTPSLVIPHPRMAQRRFVLEPLLEIEPGILHPGTKQPWSRFLEASLSQKIRKLSGN